jgi:hypothetical protein
VHGKQANGDLGPKPAETEDDEREQEHRHAFAHGRPSSLCASNRFPPCRVRPSPSVAVIGLNHVGAHLVEPSTRERVLIECAAHAPRPAPHELRVLLSRVHDIRNGQAVPTLEDGRFLERRRAIQPARNPQYTFLVAGTFKAATQGRQVRDVDFEDRQYSCGCCMA